MTSIDYATGVWLLGTDYRESVEWRKHKYKLKKGGGKGEIYLIISLITHRNITTPIQNFQ